MYTSVVIGDYDLTRDLSLILTHKSITPPSPRTYTVDIDGADGAIDLTDAMGAVRYKNRKIKMDFSCVSRMQDFPAIFTRCQNLFNGKKLKIVFLDDPAYWYYGRVTLDEWGIDSAVGTLSMEVDADPYKYRIKETSVSVFVSGTKTVVLRNEHKPAMPTVYTDASMTVVFNGVSMDFSQTNIALTNPDLVLLEGDNELTVKGTGTIRFVYQEGSL